MQGIIFEEHFRKYVAIWVQGIHKIISQIQKDQRTWIFLRSPLFFTFCSFSHSFLYFPNVALPYFSFFYIVASSFLLVHFSFWRAHNLTWQASRQTSYSRSVVARPPCDTINTRLLSLCCAISLRRFTTQCVSAM